MGIMAFFGRIYVLVVRCLVSLWFHVITGWLSVCKLFCHWVNELEEYTWIYLDRIGYICKFLGEVARVVR
jgi:8-oxo-dGTP pyrophosphatase MutT (NUDIX family)